MSVVEVNDLVTRVFKGAYRMGAESRDGDVARANAAADYWYLRAHYTEKEIAEMHERASKGLCQHWEWPDLCKHCDTRKAS